MGIWLASHGRDKCQYEMRSYVLGSHFSKGDAHLGEKQYWHYLE